MTTNEETTDEDGGNDNNDEPQVLMFPDLGGDSYLRSFAIYGEINEEQGREAIQALQILHDKICAEQSRSENPDEPCDPIELFVSTEGGHVQDMFAIYDCMRLVKRDCDIETFGVGKIMSAGILLLAGGTPGKRKVGKNCRLMMHSVQGGHFGSIKELETDIREVRWYQQQLTSALLEETKLSLKELKAIFRKKTDTYFSAEQAVKWGIADEIV
jgi:ATP-dependent Clp protease protease subunit